MPPLLSSLHDAIARPLCLCSLATLIACSISCNEKGNPSQGTDPSSQSNAPLNTPEQRTPGKAESTFLALAADSPIKWQPWNGDVFKLAKEQRKTVFALIGSGSDTTTLDILKQLNDSASTCELINKNHVPILIDTNCEPAMEFLTAGLCLKTKSLISRPLLIWFSYEGYPVSWNSARQDIKSNVDEVIARMSQTVSSLWNEGPEYILKDSREGFALKTLNTLIIPSEKPDPTSTARAIRQISSFYDPTSNNIDRIGEISDARYVNLLTKASTSNSLLDSQKERYLDIANRTANSSIIYGLVDPVDQGVFDKAQFISAALPTFSKSLKTQALSMEALYNLHQLTGNKTQLATANGIKAFTEKNLKLESGDYMQSIVYAHNQGTDNRCTWTMAELQKALTKEEFNLCQHAFGIRKTGNVPLSDDWNRDHFNNNTLTWKTTREELAKQTSIDPQTLESTLQSAMEKIAVLRNNRGSDVLQEKLVSTKALALYSKALVAGYRATGDKNHLKDAQRVFARIKDSFYDNDGKLRETKFENRLSTLPTNGITYALVCEAALNLYETTLEKTYLDLAQAIHTEMNSALKDKDDQYLYEQDFSQYPVDYKIEQAITIPDINNFSTWALAWSNSARLLRYQQDKELQEQQQTLRDYFQSLSHFSPIIILDYLTRHADLETPHVFISGTVSDELLTTAIRRPCRIITMNDSSHHDLDQEVPAGSAAVMHDGKLIGITQKASELKQWLK